tara:strand:+ start:169 stop:600 length:432 start_codon:yes stop_codon:yes gene_type:complete
MRYRVATNTEPEFLIDTAAINAKYAAIRHDPRRWWTGTFHAPYDCQFGSDAFAQLARERCSRFVAAMQKRGWDLISKLKVYEMGRARDIETNAVLLDKRNYNVKGVFQLAETPKPSRIEIPAGLVKKDPEHRITLAEANRALR